MGKPNHRWDYKNVKAFTLVEILVALVILLLIVMATFPLFTMATKITHENRARLIASELAKQELESIMAQVTATNYISEAEDAPLKTGIKEYYFDDDGKPSDKPVPNSRFAQFMARKIVGWIDDPADGLYPEDLLPFDYKILTIEIVSPSLFTGKVVEQADFKTFIAREGATSPLTGVIIELVRGWTDESGNRIPIEGATVNLNGSGSSPDVSALTNQDGIAMIPFVFADEGDVYSYTVELEYPGMIPRPEQRMTIEARPNTTSTMQMEMDFPGSIRFFFTPILEDCQVTLDGIGGAKTKTLSKGSSSVTFSNLWPAGTDANNPLKNCEGGFYSVKTEPMLIYQLALGAGKGQANADEFESYLSSDEESKNLWVYYDNLDGEGSAWCAAKANYDGETNFFARGQHRIATTELVDITNFAPANKTINAELSAAFALDLSNYSSLSNSFPLVYIGRDNIDIKDDTGWEPFLRFNRLGNRRALIDCNNETVAAENVANKISNPNGISFPSSLANFDSPFHLRFDSDPLAESFVFIWRNFDIYSAYEKSGLSFKGANDNLSVRINGNNL